MQVDVTTIENLGIFHPEKENSIFEFFNQTQTVAGKFKLQQALSQPQTDQVAIEAIAASIQLSGKVKWPKTITNGTLMVLEQFLISRVDTLPKRPSVIEALFFKWLRIQEFSLLRYTIQHLHDFLTGVQELLSQLSDHPIPLLIEKTILILKDPSNQEVLTQLIHSKREQIAPGTVLSVSHFIKHRYRRQLHDLMDACAQIDAWMTIHHVGKTQNFVYPQWLNQDFPECKLEGLYHPLLTNPTSYDIHLHPEQNFMFLTSANMGGKSTLIKSVGVTSYLAHCGFPVPCKSAAMTFMDGLLTNIHIADNLSKGESYFYNEVMRISDTVSKISNTSKWLVLIDELFKGTNVQDAMKCSTVVIEGLIKLRTSLFIVSTHLYEIAEDLKKYPNIQFRYFETSIVDDKPVFHYNLKEGISQDRLGYLILKQSGVVKKLLEL